MSFDPPDQECADLLTLAQSVANNARTGEQVEAFVARSSYTTVRAHGGEENDRITVSGPAVALDFEHVQTFAHALHELAANAVKHGALAL